MHLQRRKPQQVFGTYMRYVPTFSKKTETLTRLTKKTVVWTRGDKQCSGRLKILSQRLTPLLYKSGCQLQRSCFSAGGEEK